MPNRKREPVAHRSGLRLTAVLLALLTALSLLPLSALAKTGGSELGDVMTLSHAKLYGCSYDDLSSDSEPYKDHDLIPKDQSLTLLYQFAMSKSQIETVLANNSDSDLKYSIPDVTGLVVQGASDSKPLTVTVDIEGESSKDYTFGALLLDAGSAYVTFDKDVLQELLTLLSDEDTADDAGLIKDGYLYLGCQLDNDTKPDAVPGGQENRYLFTFADSTELVFGYEGEEPKSETGGSLTKEAGKYDPATRTITWTITLTPYQNTKKTELQIRDTIDLDKQTLAMQSDGTTPDVSVTRGASAGPIVGASVTYDPDSGLLTIDTLEITEANWDQSITVTYQTKVTEESLLPEGTGATRPAFNIKNAAELWGKENEDMDITKLPLPTATATASVPAANWIRKEGNVVDGSNGRTIDWTVTVDTGGVSVSGLKLTDTLPKGTPPLTLVNGSVKVNGTQPASQPTLQDGDGSSDTQYFTIDLATNSDGIAKITYQTAIPESWFETGKNLSGLQNTAEISFNWTGTGAGETRDFHLSVGKGLGINTSLLTKKGAGYDRATHAITWEVTVNPNKANITAATLTDDLTKVGSQGVTYVADSFQVTKHNGADADATQKALISLADNTNDQDGTLTFTVGDIGQNTVTIQFQTRVNAPQDYAYNNGDKSYKNTVDMSYTISGGSSPQTTKAQGSQTVTSHMLAKSAVGYNYADNTITWKVRLNENQMPLTGANLTDPLAEGLAYVDGSLAVSQAIDPKTGTNDAPKDDDATAKATATSAPTEGDEGSQTLTIGLGDLCSNECRVITFQTKVDVDAIEAFQTAPDAVVSNGITLSRGGADDFGVPFTSLDSNTATQTVAAKALQKTATEHFSDGYISYSVTVNPHRLDLKNAVLVDTLCSGLQVDLDSVKLYAATVTNDNQGGATFAKGEAVPADQWALTNFPQGNDSNIAANSFAVKLPDGAAAYQLEYNADILTDLEAGKTYTNSIRFGAYLGGDDDHATGGNVPPPAGGGGGGGGAAGAVAKRKGSIVLTKTDADHPLTRLPGVGFELRSEDGTLLVASGTTDENGELTFSGLTVNKTYLLKEADPPIGYLPTEDQMILVNQTTATGAIAVSVSNQIHKNTIEFRKKGIRDRNLSGAEFTLYTDAACTTPYQETVIGSDGVATQVPKVAISDDLGKVTFADLPYQPTPYYIKETKSPAHYLLDDSVYTAQIMEDGAVSALSQYQPAQPATEPADPTPILELVNAPDPIDPPSTGSSGGGHSSRPHTPEVPPVTDPETPPVTDPETPPVTEPETPPVTDPVDPPAEPPVTSPETPPAQTLPDRGVQGSIGAQDPHYTLDENGVPRGIPPTPDPTYWLDDQGVPLGYLSPEGEWVWIEEGDIPLGFQSPDGDWVDFVPQTGDDTQGLALLLLLLGVTLGGLTVYRLRRRPTGRRVAPHHKRG